MSKRKQPNTRASTPQAAPSHSGAETPSAEPAFNGELPHAAKKVSLGPNTKR